MSCTDVNKGILYCSGPVRRFKRLCELIQSMIMSPNHVMTVGHRISTDLSSDASSTSYSSMDRVSPTPDEVEWGNRSNPICECIKGAWSDMVPWINGNGLCEQGRHSVMSLSRINYSKAGTFPWYSISLQSEGSG